MPMLGDWANFYVIIGSSAGGLIGLTFVVISLMAARRRNSQFLRWGLATFMTPTIVHFSVALFTAAMLSAPWPALWQAAILLGASGVGGLIYGAIVLRSILRHTDYTPVLEDWVFYAFLPLLNYSSLVLAALLLSAHTTLALFIVAAALFLLLIIGIHNAWDLATYNAGDSAEDIANRAEQQVDQPADSAQTVE